MACLPRAILTMTASATIRWFSSSDIAPGANGASYGTNLLPGSVNDSGDVNFAAQPVTEPALTYLYCPLGKLGRAYVGLADSLAVACPFASRWAGLPPAFFLALQCLL